MTFYEFFAGGGMVRAGLGVRWRCLFANDVSPQKARIYRRNWGGDTLILADIAALTARLYAETPPELHPAAARNVFAHLVDLHQRGEVKAHPDLGPEAIFEKS